MAVAMICDRCGDFFKIENVRHGESVSDCIMVGVRCTDGGEIYDKKWFDICPKCKESLNQWINKFYLLEKVVETEEQDNGKDNNQS